MITRLRREARKTAVLRGEQSSEGIYQTLKAQYKEERRMRPMPKFMRRSPHKTYEEENPKVAFSPNGARELRKHVEGYGKYVPQPGKRKARNGNSRQRRRDKING